MEKTIEIHAYHGWGFSAACWNEWKEVLPENVLLKPADRGYFGAEFIPEYHSKAEKKILFLHSYGVHWCPKEEFEIADYIIIFNGFDSFHPNEWVAKNRSKKILSGMVAEFKKNPKKVLNRFYANCYSPGSLYTTENLQWINRSRLSADLTALHKTKLKPSNKLKATWLIIDSGRDKIVPGKRGEELKGIVGPMHYHFVEDAGHALPLANAHECFGILSNTLPIFDAQ